MIILRVAVADADGRDTYAPQTWTCACAALYDHTTVLYCINDYGTVPALSGISTCTVHVRNIVHEGRQSWWLFVVCCWGQDGIYVIQHSPILVFYLNEIYLSAVSIWSSRGRQVQVIAISFVTISLLLTSTYHRYCTVTVLLEREIITRDYTKSIKAGIWLPEWPPSLPAFHGPSHQQVPFQERSGDRYSSKLRY